MVYSQEMTPKRGQEYRDRVRCEALENLGFIVHTVDDKHVDHPRHCNANFNNDRAFVHQRKMGARYAVQSYYSSSYHS